MSLATSCGGSAVPEAEQGTGYGMTIGSFDEPHAIPILFQMGLEGAIARAQRNRPREVELEILQSNHEGELVDFLHKNMDSAAGGIVNPAGLTQHGVSLHDAIKAMPFPMAEVHMSNIAAREEWRHHSIISSAVKGTVQGFGWRSYTAALRLLAELAQERQDAERAAWAAPGVKMVNDQLLVSA